MKKRFLLLFSIVLFSTINLFANHNYRYEYERVKHIKKNYTCSQDVLFVLTNKYGCSNIELWDKNEVEIKVEIKARTNNERDVNRIFDMISIEFKTSHSMVVATTIINEGIMQGKPSYEINYSVFLPRKANIELHNKHGDIRVGESNGSFMSDINYGNLYIGTLNSNKANLISKYGNIKIGNGNCGNAEINIDYGHVIARSFKNLNITSSYSDFTADNVENINVSAKYGNYIITRCSKINISEGGYTNFYIDNLKTSFLASDGAIKYGSIKIGGINPMLQQIKLNCSYTDVSLNFAEKVDYNFDLSTSSGDIRVSHAAAMKFNLTHNKEGNRSAAYFKSANNKSVIAIKSRYGNINLH